MHIHTGLGVRVRVRVLVRLQQEPILFPSKIINFFCVFFLQRKRLGDADGATQKVRGARSLQKGTLSQKSYLNPKT
jgi:hypothetical protein